MLTKVIALFLLATSISTAADTLRVMSYNIWYVFAKGKEQEAGKRWVASQSPDVVSLQELTNIKPEKLQELANGWNHPHSSLLKTKGFSVGLTSRWPIEVVEKRLQGMHHGYLHAKIQNVHYFAVHLSPFKWEMRSKEADILNSKIKPLIEKGEKVIVLGDFNAVSPADRKWLDSNKELLAKTAASDKKNNHVANLNDGKFDYSVMERFFGAGLIDTSEKHLSKESASRLSFPTGIFDDQKTAVKSGKRIDFILASPNLAKTVTSSKVITQGVVNKLSDHYPVITDFVIKEGK